MKYIILVVINIITFSSNLISQNNIDKILTEIENNNTTLSALRKSMDAEKIGNKTDIYLQNPEIEFNYLWGNPSTIGNRTDVNIKQTFDFPTTYSYKNHISNLKNEQVEFEYQKQRKSLFLETYSICFDLVFTNALISELSKRIVHAQSIANSYKSKYDIGEINILEYNKAQLNLLNISKELESIEIERIALLSELTRLNGGNFIYFNDTSFQTPVIPHDFERWYVLAVQNNPVLGWLKLEIEINQKQEKLNRAMSLPKLQAGYISEKVIGQQFQGVTGGLSIPLWENKNKVKFAKAKTIALESIATDNKLQFYNHLKTMHTKAIGLQKNVNDYRLSLLSFDNSELLKKALDKGEISLISYILELSIYYESVNKLLELEREMNKTLAELNQYI
ncbi:MAG: TolC family protein [Bacteroidetes bacterium]|nr:TolC family protein [Bacteroidota bacterium]MBL6944843.1 TolC family protein [Bacteroidales bacterium]